MGQLNVLNIITEGLISGSPLLMSAKGFIIQVTEEIVTVPENEISHPVRGALFIRKESRKIKRKLSKLYSYPEVEAKKIKIILIKDNKKLVFTTIIKDVNVDISNIRYKVMENKGVPVVKLLF